jgi:hypothetical protein
LASIQDVTLGIALGWSGHDGGGDAIFLHRVRRVQALTGENLHYTHDSLGYTLAVSMQIDLHGYHPREIVWNGALLALVEQVWEMGESELVLIHGHGRNRGITPGFVNTNTGFFGLEIRKALRHDVRLRRWIHYTTLDCSNPGHTRVSLKANHSPTRTRLDLELLLDDGIQRSGR